MARTKSNESVEDFYEFLNEGLNHNLNAKHHRKICKKSLSMKEDNKKYHNAEKIFKNRF